MKQDINSTFGIESNDNYTGEKVKSKQFNDTALSQNDAKTMLIQQAKDKHCEAINKRHAVVKMGGKVLILDESLNDKNKPSYDFLNARDFDLLMQNKPKLIDAYKSNGKPEYITASKAWLEHHARREYDGILFDPTGCDNKRYFNLFRGLPYEAGEQVYKHEFKLLDDHIKNIIANGDNAVYEYLYKWLAYQVQNLGAKTGVVPVLKGKQGAGKGVFVNFIGGLFGDYYLHVSNSDNITGRFNAQLERTLFMFCDEAIFGGDKKALNTLKALVSEPTMMIENKGLDSRQVRNWINFIFASNEESVLPLDPDNRRYMILNVSDKYAPNTARKNGTEKEAGDYWKALRHECDQQATKKAFLGYLMAMDLSNFIVGDFPRTEAEKAELASGLDSLGAWFYQYITNTELIPYEITSKPLYDDYLSYCDRMKLGEYKRKSDKALNDYLTSLGIERKRKATGRFYKLVSREHLMTLFEQNHGLSFENDA
jgi:hypothetical protein